MRNVLTQENFTAEGGNGSVVSWFNTVTVENVHPNIKVTLRMNNLSGHAADLKLYAYSRNGKLTEVSKKLWSIQGEGGKRVSTLSADMLYEVRITVTDDSGFDLTEAEKEIKISVVLGK